MTSKQSQSGAWRIASEPLCSKLGGEYLGFVSLPAVQELALGFGKLLLDIGEVAARIEKLLSGEDPHVGGFNCRFDA